MYVYIYIYTNVYIYTCTYAYTYTNRHTYELYTYVQPSLEDGPKHDTEWRRLLESPKLQIIFRKRATKYRSLLRKMSLGHAVSCVGPSSREGCTYVYLS